MDFDIFNYIDPVATEASNKAVKLEPKYGTPLYNCVLNAYQPHPGEIVEADSHRNVAYETTLDDTTDMLANNVVGYLSFVKNKVIPTIKDLYDNVKEDMVKYTTIDPVADFSVVVYSLPSVLELYTIKERLNKLYSRKVSPPNRNYTLPDLDFEELDTTIKSIADHDVVEEVTKLYKDKPSVLTEAYEKYVKYIYAGDYNFAWKEKNLDLLTLGYILSIALIENPPEGINMSGSDYELMMATVANHLGHILATRQKVFKDTYLKYKRLVLSADKDKKEVVVFEPVYMEYLSNGGSVEGVLGYLLRDAGKLITLKEALEEKHDEYNKAWKEYINYSILKGKAERVSIAQSVIRRRAKEQLREIVNNDESLPENFTSRAMEYVENIIKSLKQEQLDDLHKLVKDVVSNGYFGDTDVSIFLDIMDSVSKDYPDMDVKEILGISMVYYVSTYVAGQFEVKKLV